MLEYDRLGVGSFLIRGFDPLADTTEFGRELIPMLKAGAAADRARCLCARAARDGARLARGARADCRSSGLGG